MIADLQNTLSAEMAISECLEVGSRRTVTFHRKLATIYVYSDSFYLKRLWQTEYTCWMRVNISDYNRLKIEDLSDPRSSVQFNSIQLTQSFV